MNLSVEHRELTVIDPITKWALFYRQQRHPEPAPYLGNGTGTAFLMPKRGPHDWTLVNLYDQYDDANVTRFGAYQDFDTDILRVDIPRPQASLLAFLNQDQES